ncbi:MAG: hypothetical protein LBT97_01815 [Planctomycetota bacterium]|jgi:hypothetical protein|nr:hypothetical protein [Planctomycetota bacterium]
MRLFPSTFKGNRTNRRPISFKDSPAFVARQWVVFFVASTLAGDIAKKNDSETTPRNFEGNQSAGRLIFLKSPLLATANHIAYHDRLKAKMAARRSRLLEGIKQAAV